MNKYVIFSAIIGEYDKILQPLVVDERFDYIIFSDHLSETNNGVWQIRRIEYNNPIQTKIARYVKTHPEKLLPEYEASLWLDANIRITDHRVYDRFIELMDKGVSVAGIKHPDCDCVYEELFRVLDFRYESEKVVLKWGEQLRRKQYTKHAGLIETNLLFRIHSLPEVMLLDNLWWYYIELYSRRDQVSFPVALYECGLKCDLFVPGGQTVRNYEGTEYLKHMNDSSKFNPNEKKAWLMRHYYKHHEDKDKVANLYYWCYGRKWPVFWATVLGQFYRLKDRLGWF